VTKAPTPKKSKESAAVAVYLLRERLGDRRCGLLFLCHDPTIKRVAAWNIGVRHISSARNADLTAATFRDGRGPYENVHTWTLWA